MTDPSNDALPYRTRFAFGGCWPAIVGFLLASVFMAVLMNADGDFARPFSRGEPGEIIPIAYPFIFGAMFGLPALGINSLLFAIIRARSKRDAFVLGLLALLAAMFAGLSLMWHL